MRVLIADQESEMLETIARSFEVDVATSKVTCIDLMRANPFDVLVASERLSDGSGLELLSHVATRWPDTLRVLVIEPARMKLLRGKLGPFRLHATLKYPIDEDELEAVLNRMYQLLGDEEVAEEEEEEAPEPEPPPRATPVTPPRGQTATAATTVTKVQKVQLPQPSTQRGSPVASGAKGAPSRPGAASNLVSSSKAARNSTPLGAPRNDPAPVKRRLGNYTPLGSPEDAQMRIVEREFDHSAAPLASRAVRTREEASRPRTRAEKAKSLAAHLSNTLRRLLKR